MSSSFCFFCNTFLMPFQNLCYFVFRIHVTVHLLRVLQYHHPHHHTDAAQSLETEDIPPSAQIVNQSVFLKTPNPTVFTKYQTVAIDSLYPETDIVEGAEAEGLLHDHGIQG